MATELSNVVALARPGRGLALALAHTEAVEEAGEEVVGHLVCSLALDLETNADRLAASVGGQLDPAVAPTVIHAALAAFLAVLRHADLASGWRAPIAVTDHARSVARDGRGVAVLLRAYRVGHMRLSTAIAQGAHSLTRDPVLRDAVVARASELLFAFVDALTDQAIAAYEQERTSAHGHPDRQRIQAVRKILAGAEPDARVLGHDFTADQLAVVVWMAGEPAPGDRRLLIGAAAGLQDSDTLPTLTVPTDGQACMWIAADAEQSGAVVAAAASLAADNDRLRVAIGEPSPGVAGFRRTHTEAMLVRRMMSAGRSGRPVVRYGDVALAAMCSADPDRVADFVHQELGPLSADDAPSAQLRETLTLYLQMGHAAAAGRLGVHKNTIRNRVRQCEQMLGHHSSERRFQLQAALLLIDAFGPPAAQ